MYNIYTFKRDEYFRERERERERKREKCVNSKLESCTQVKINKSIQKIN